MKQRLQSKKSFYIMAGCSILSIILGFFIVSATYDRYQKHVRENVDSQLFQFTESVDRSLEIYLGRYMRNLVHTAEHQEIREAELIWTETGNGEIWKRRIRTSLLSQSEGFSDVLLMDNGKVLLSLENGRNYYFPEQEERGEEIQIRPCLDQNGSVYLAFTKESSQELEYAALIDFAQFYKKIAGEQPAHRENQIMLLD